MPAIWLAICHSVINSIWILRPLLATIFHLSWLSVKYEISFPFYFYLVHFARLFSLPIFSYFCDKPFRQILANPFDFGIFIFPSSYYFHNSHVLGHLYWDVSERVSIYPIFLSVSWLAGWVMFAVWSIIGYNNIVFWIGYIIILRKFLYIFFFMIYVHALSTK